MVVFVKIIIGFIKGRNNVLFMARGIMHGLHVKLWTMLMVGFWYNMVR